MSERERSLLGTTGLLCLFAILALSSCGDSKCTEVETSHGESLTFLFGYCSGNEPYGDCAYTHFWYFEYDSDGTRYLGDWYAGYEPKNPPAWWDEAAVGWACYRENEGCMRGLWADNEDVSTTPMPDQEAEEVALWLSGSLVAPESLYLLVLSGLADVRETYGDMLPRVVEPSFKPPWFVSRVDLRLTPEAVEEYDRGEYHDLDSLNASLGLVEMLRYQPNRFWLVFEGRLNPERLAETYGDVESVLKAESSRLHHGGSYLVPWVADPR